ncbi:conserved hypothetical protein [Histoplasma capsulatum H143]|uniref:HNH nuclease domain-containing protein n=1 Tax=Ajellomyces capsulatus (strain H143) TaxID=544712 RepID=C6HPF8_AJECH|nr:conserved hypothetical protein [Histoplasma capsulatum H143]
MALHQHQSSLEKVLEFSQSFSLTAQQHRAATTLFRYLIQHYGLEQTIQPGYKSAALIQATFEHVTSKDAFLLFLFSHIYKNLCSGVANPIDSDITVVLSFFDGFSSWDQNQKQNANGAIESFAEYIVENFLLPRMPSIYTSPPPESYVNTDNLVRASSVKTPQPTPTSSSSIQASTPTGTTQRVSILRQSCLVRDHHRCVVSRKFDKNEAGKRWKQDGEDCKDDDRNPLKNESSDRFQYLESDSKKNALQILNMFDSGVIHLIDGPKINSPLNALTLTHDHHQSFREFQIYFEPTSRPYEYRIDSMEKSPSLRDPLFPVTRTLTPSPNRTIDPPSARLLGIHRAIAKIMKLSGADEYIDTILRDLEEVDDVRADGSTNLGHMMSLRLGGWVNPLPAINVSLRQLRPQRRTSSTSKKSTGHYKAESRGEDDHSSRD